eukprot:UC1_evm1s708
MSAEYARVQVKQFPQLARRETAENRYWQKLEMPTMVKEHTAINSVSFSPVAPYDFLFTSGLRVHLYSSSTNKAKKGILPFKDTALTASFRGDGQLFVAAAANGKVAVFNPVARQPLRRFEGHSRACHAAVFSSGSTQVFTGGDDSCVRVWDLPAETETITLRGHEDYVRCLAPAAHAPHLVFAGSYDHTARLWDTRAGIAGLTVNHGAPVEAVATFPSGGSFVTAGGNTIRVWDALGTGRLLASFSNHQKAITSLQFDSDHKRLISGGLDRHVKVYDVASWKVVHAFKEPAPILDLALAPTETHFVAGTSTGLLSIRQRKQPISTEAATAAARRAPRPGSYKYFLRGHDYRAERKDIKVEVERKHKLKPYDRLMRKFQYALALDAVLEGRPRAVVVVSVLQELVRRSGLKQALSGRDETALRPVLVFLVKNVTNPRYARLLIGVANVLLDVYAGQVGLSPTIDALLEKLLQKLRAEVALQERLLETLGSIDAILAAGAR